MRVCTSSWHYRLHQYWLFETRKSLCSYFWSTVLLVILSVMMCWWVFWKEVISPLYERMFWKRIAKKAQAEQRRINYLNWLRRHDHAAYMLEMYPETLLKKPEKEPGLVSEYLKAVKDKACPIIEFYDR